MLVALRLVIGWHFFREGVSHRTDSHWSSEGFLKQANGPMAPLYQGVLPDFHGWNKLMLAPLPAGQAGGSAEAGDDDEPEAAPKAVKEVAVKEAAAKEPVAKSPVSEAGGKMLAVGENPNAKAAPEAKKTSPLYEPWLTAAKRDWKTDADQLADYYKFDAAQKQQADELQHEAAKRTDRLLASFEPDIRMYRELVSRAEEMAHEVDTNNAPPYQSPRAVAAEHNPLGEAGLNGQSSPLSTTPVVWEGGAKAIDHLYHDRLVAIVTPDQLKMGTLPDAAKRVHQIDSIVIWMLIVVGGLLIVGLFARLAAVVGALFLLSIILTQPPWLAEAIPTYNQWVEFVAMLTLATLPVGRWGGLDYFVSKLFCRRCCPAEGKQV